MRSRIQSKVGAKDEHRLAELRRIRTARVPYLRLRSMGTMCYAARMMNAPKQLAQSVASLIATQLWDRFSQLRHTIDATHLELLASAARYDDPRCLTRFGYRTFSQNEEDGIIDEVFHRIGAGAYFVEFGAQTGLQNNTLALLLSGWRGLWIEADRVAFGKLTTEFREPLLSGQLTALCSFVTAENIQDLFRRANVPEEFDLLSIDIDGNDYWIWNAVTEYRPRVVVIEYNASLGRTASIVAPYGPNAIWDGSVRYGASLAALENLGREKGYSLVGCNLLGVNAFFVRNDCLGDKFLPPYSSAKHYEPPRYGISGAGHRPGWGRFAQVGARPG